MPGYVLPTDPPGSSPGVGVSMALLDESENVAVDLTGKIAGRLHDDLEGIQATADRVQGVLTGSILSALGAIQKAAEKIAGKIDKAINGSLNEAYGIAGGLGYEYPTIEDAHQQNQPQSLPPPNVLDPTQPPGSGGGGQTSGCSPFEPTWPPVSLLDGPPDQLPPPGDYTPWRASSNDVACYDRQIAMVWMCDPLTGARHPTMVGSPPGRVWMVSPDGRLIAAPVYLPGYLPLNPIPGTVQNRPANCSPPTVPGGGGGDGGGGGGHGGADCCIPPDRLLISPTWQWHSVTNQPDGTTHEQPWDFAATDVPSGTYRWVRVIVCGQQWGPPSGPQIEMPLGYGLFYGPNGVVYSRPGPDAADIIGCIFDSGIDLRIGGGDTNPGGGGGDHLDPDAKCPNPPVPVCPPPAVEIPKLGQLEDEECSHYEDMVKRYVNFKGTADGIIGMDSGEPPPAVSVSGSFWTRITGQTGNILPNLINRFNKWGQKIIVSVSKSSTCADDRLLSLSVFSGVLKFVNQWFAIIPKAYLVPMQQAENFLCQYEIPTGDAADNAYLSDTITKGVWECYQKANGNMLRGADAVMLAKRARANSTMLVMLYRRKAITLEKFNELMRKEGFVNEADRDRVLEVTKSWPALDDVIRMMTRDVTDEPTMTKYDADNKFDENTAGGLMKYAEALGVDKELLRMYWRAHWRVPSYTQAMEMYHRQRYDDTPENLKVSLEDVKQLLIYDDMMPYWVDRMVAIADHPITRIDAQRAYSLHVTDEEKLKRQYMSLGYNDADADMMVEISKAKRLATENQRSGLPTPRTMTNQFARGVLSEDDLRAQLEAVGYTEDRLERAVKSAQIARHVRTRDEAIKSVRSAYLNGLVSESEALTDLGRVGVDPEAASELSALWTVQRRSRGKIAAASQLCKWRGQNLISAQQQVVGLIRVGWSDADAERIVNSCQIDITEKERERQYRDLQRARAEAARQEKEAEKARKRQQALIDSMSEGQASIPAG